jgi:hypothetical protein
MAGSQEILTIQMEMILIDGTIVLGSRARRVLVGLSCNAPALAAGADMNRFTCLYGPHCMAYHN